MKNLLGIITLLSLGTIMELANCAELQQDTSTGRIFYQGDIVLSSSDFYQAQQEANAARTRPWPNGVIPYEFSSQFSTEEKLLVGRAMLDLQARTCIRFVPRGSHPDYVYIMKDEGKCYSFVGQKGGMQMLSLANGCLSHGIILHELMHAVGFWHEQSRRDRDDYVSIDWGSIDPSHLHNFLMNRNRHNDWSLPYDYGSITHYDKTYISPKLGDLPIGRANVLSSLDVLGIQYLYNCPVEQQRPCGDVDQYFCPALAADGDCCDADVKDACRISCNTCGYRPDSCQDTGDNCSLFADNGLCRNMEDFARRVCKRTCNLC